ncbi:transposase [Streptomyces sp. NPDC050538]|uniref:IS110 family transposase n=1 Tax=Streptomyces sp. NPDC050538 TaxID=3365627 RepID=UPI0037897E46
MKSVEGVAPTVSQAVGKARRAASGHGRKAAAQGGTPEDPEDEPSAGSRLPVRRAPWGRSGPPGAVDQCVEASIDALPVAVAVARASGCEVAYLPGLSMRRLADLHPGSGKADARDAFVIADAARTMPHLLRSIMPDGSVRAEPAMVLGHDDDLAGDATCISNGLLASIHPALERVLGPRLRHPAVPALLQAFGSPAALAALAQAGPEEITRTLLGAAPRMRTAQKLTEQVMAALAEQTVTVPGTAAAGDIIPGLAKALTVILHRREVLEDRILAVVGDGSAFPTAAHLASCAGLAPTTYRSGTSIRGEGSPSRGNEPLKRALFPASFASLSSPDSRAYYDRKRGEGKRHNAALICLTRRRIDVLHAMLNHRAAYQPAHEQAA